MSHQLLLNEPYFADTAGWDDFCQCRLIADVANRTAHINLHLQAGCFLEVLVLACLCAVSRTIVCKFDS